MVRSFSTTAGCALIALVGAFSLTTHAGQARTVASGVYSAAQAGRGQKTYVAQCVACHGETLGGVVGPMLAGTGFTNNWSGKSLNDLVDKIQNTMPVQAPKSLSRDQAIELASYILQVGKFPAGNADLAAAGLAAVTFPATAKPAAPMAGGLQIDVTANLAQYMRGVTFPNANVIFNLQLKEPQVERPAPVVPFNYLYWGYNQYWGWQAVDQAALALIETTPLLLLPRRCENGLPAPVDRADYKQMTQDLINFGKQALKTSQARDYEGMVALAEKLDAACLNCHKVYRDSAREGVAGTNRCK